MPLVPMMVLLPIELISVLSIVRSYCVIVIVA